MVVPPIKTAKPTAPNPPSSDIYPEFQAERRKTAWKGGCCYSQTPTFISSHVTVFVIIYCTITTTLASKYIAKAFSLHRPMFF